MTTLILAACYLAIAFLTGLLVCVGTPEPAGIHVALDEIHVALLALFWPICAVIVAVGLFGNLIRKAAVAIDRRFG